VDDPSGSLLEPFKKDAADLLSELLPQIMRCLPDWPSYEPKQDAGKQDGNGDAIASREKTTE
jgi:hypothetical protein